MPTSSAARITSVPLGTLTSTSSIVSVISSTGAGSLRNGFDRHSAHLLREQGRGGRREGPAGRRVHAGFELLAEVLDRRGDRAGRSVAEGAERAAEDVVAQVEQQVDVAVATLASVETLQGLHQPPRAFAARVHLPHDSCL